MEILPPPRLVCFTVQTSGVLGGEQRDEWRGWMQLVILVYQMTGAEAVEGLRLLVHTLTTAHLFLLGYSHFTFLFHTADFSLLRFARVLARYNLLTVICCLVRSDPPNDLGESLRLRKI